MSKEIELKSSSLMPNGKVPRSRPPPRPEGDGHAIGHPDDFPLPDGPLSFPRPHRDDDARRNPRGPGLPTAEGQRLTSPLHPERDDGAIGNLDDFPLPEGPLSFPRPHRDDDARRNPRGPGLSTAEWERRAFPLDPERFDNAIGNLDDFPPPYGSVSSPHPHRDDSARRDRNQDWPLDARRERLSSPPRLHRDENAMGNREDFPRHGWTPRPDRDGDARRNRNNRELDTTQGQRLTSSLYPARDDIEIGTTEKDSRLPYSSLRPERDGSARRTGNPDWSFDGRRQDLSSSPRTQRDENAMGTREDFPRRYTPDSTPRPHRDNDARRDWKEPGLDSTQGQRLTSSLYPARDDNAIGAPEKDPRLPYGSPRPERDDSARRNGNHDWSWSFDGRKQHLSSSPRPERDENAIGTEEDFPRPHTPVSTPRPHRDSDARRDWKEPGLPPAERQPRSSPPGSQRDDDLIIEVTAYAGDNVTRNAGKKWRNASGPARSSNSVADLRKQIATTSPHAPTTASVTWRTYLAVESSSQAALLTRDDYLALLRLFGTPSPPSQMNDTKPLKDFSRSSPDIDRWDSAIHVIKAMEAAGHERDDEVNLALLRICARDGLAERADEVLTWIRERGKNVDAPDVLELAVIAWARGGAMTMALGAARTHADALSPAALTAVIEGLCRADSVEAALTIRKSIVLRDPDPVVRAAVLRDASVPIMETLASGQDGNVGRVVTLFMELEAFGRVSSLAAWNALLWAFIRKGDIAAAQTVLRDLHSTVQVSNADTWACVAVVADALRNPHRVWQAAAWLVNNRESGRGPRGDMARAAICSTVRTHVDALAWPEIHTALVFGGCNPDFTPRILPILVQGYLEMDAHAAVDNVLNMVDTFPPCSLEAVTKHLADGKSTKEMALANVFFRIATHLSFHNRFATLESFLTKRRESHKFFLREDKWMMLVRMHDSLEGRPHRRAMIELIHKIEGRVMLFPSKIRRLLKSSDLGTREHELLTDAIARLSEVARASGGLKGVGAGGGAPRSRTWEGPRRSPKQVIEASGGPTGVGAVVGTPRSRTGEGPRSLSEEAVEASGGRTGVDAVGGAPRSRTWE
ncbi:hypothetical protein BDK51DRAFT_42365, partial [Blyttiomyces helicus]